MTIYGTPHIMTVSGEVPVRRGDVFLNGTAAIAATLAVPTSLENNYILRIQSVSAYQHTLTLSATRLNGATLGTITFGGAQGTAGITAELRAFNGTWFIHPGTNYTLA